MRFLAAARDATFARAERSSALMVLRLRFPPFDPIARIALRIISRVSFAILASVSQRLGGFENSLQLGLDGLSAQVYSDSVLMFDY